MTAIVFNSENAAVADAVDARTAPYAALLLRVTMGLLFLAHAWLKIVVFTPAGTAQFFESVGLPGALAYVTIGVEVLGGIALIAGLFVRVVAPVLALVLVGAIAAVHIHAGFFFTSPNGGWEYPAFWAIALVAQALLGPGAFALRLDRTA